ncbi:MAG TPA: diguanylate cyclase, partial [Candidatus Binatia bacterium]|nr:diguanylate cyclase [Candidatus Binatia bacterium]
MVPAQRTATPRLQGKRFDYQFLFDSPAIGIVVSDLNGRIRQYNSALARMLSKSQTEHKPLTVAALFPERWHEKEELTRAEVLKNGVTDEYQSELCKKDGTVLRVVIKKWLQFDEFERAQKIWLLVRDVTNKKPQNDVMYQRAILFVDSQVRYQSLLAKVPVGILTIDKRGRVESINPAAEELFGYRSTEVVGKRLQEFVATGNGEPLPITPSQGHITIVRCHNGKLLSVQVTSSSFHAEDPQIYTCFLRDVTADLQAREAIERMQETEIRLREGTEEIARLSDALQAEISERTWAQEQFQVAVESAPNGILIVENGKITLVNAQIEHQFGYDRGELLGRPIQTLLPERFHSHDAKPRESFFAGSYIDSMGEGGELYGLRKDGREFPMEIGINPIHTPGGKGVLLSVIDVTERKRVESELKKTAFHDALTGLPNRTLFLDNLLRLNAAAKRHGHHPFALLFLDLDRFKVINDSLGHLAGDRFLIQTAQRLVECTREEDTVARLGGDEFAILLEQIRGPEDAIRVAERALARIAEPTMLDDNEVSVGVSIGIALSISGEKNPENLLRDADMAMYQAKTRHSGYQIFDARMHARALERMRLEIDMKRAIERKQIHLHYQPIVSLESGMLVGFEALARWQHDGRGAVSPSQFIPLAEETGLVAPLSSWVFREACRQMRNWQENFAVKDDCFMSVNVSSKQVSHGNLIEELDDVLN